MGISVQDIITNAAQAAAQSTQKPSTQRFRYRATGGAIGTLDGSNTPSPAESPAAQAQTPAITATGKRKSGYAADLHPDLLDAAEKAGLATPPAGDKGAQRGRVPPAIIRPQAHYEPVEVDEAMRRATLRRKGQLSPIEGGLNDPKIVSTASAPIDQYEDNAMEVGDAPGLVSHPAALSKSAKLLTMAKAEELDTKTPAASKRITDMLKPSKQEQYFKQRTRVSFVMPNGTYAVPAIDVRIEENGVIILLPYGDNDATFIPNAGSKFGVVHGGKHIDCYFPGTVFTLDTLNVTILTLLRDIKDDAQN